jgi:Sulfotransferase domain
MKKTPIRNGADHAAVLQGLKNLLSGYTAITDVPTILFTEELVEAFPDAKVICTIRDPDSWWNSFKFLVENGDRQMFFTVVFALVPTMRYFQQWINLCRGRWSQLYSAKDRRYAQRGIYDDHMEYVTRVVPKDRLHFYNVQDGWEPLCKILGCEVPDVPFPRTNDAATTKTFFKYQIMRGIMAWIKLGAGVALSAAIALSLWRRGWRNPEKR